MQRWERWAAAHRDVRRPLIWMHAPSVGEGLQARPVLELLRAEHPQWQLAYSFFSPSAEPFARRMSEAKNGASLVDVADYLPFDTPGDTRRLLELLRPSVLVFAKLDLWPVLCEEATRARVPYALISGTMSPASSRGSGMARALLRDAYAGVAAAGAISADDAQRLQALGVSAARLEVMGDTRYDQVWTRAMAVDRTSGLVAALKSTRPTLVAGSTWPADESALLPAWERVRQSVPTARLVIAPHEPTASHCEPIVRFAAAAGLSLDRITGNRVSDADVILVDTVGMLGDLYALGTAAYVGGGFHAAGLHSVLEPAAFGAPVCFGPRHSNARDATVLIEAGGAAEVSGEAPLAELLARWLTGGAAGPGAKAQAVVQGGLGAARRATALVTRLVKP